MRQKERKTRRRKEERRCEKKGKEKVPKCRRPLRMVGKIRYKTRFFKGEVSSRRSEKFRRRERKGGKEEENK
jgi:hypothetical protein